MEESQLPQVLLDEPLDAVAHELAAIFIHLDERLGGRVIDRVRGRPFIGASWGWVAVQKMIWDQGLRIVVSVGHVD